MAKSYVMTTFKKNIEAVLAEKGWTKQELADRCGMDRSYLSKLIDGKHSPKLCVAEEIARACGMELHELLTPALQVA